MKDSFVGKIECIAMKEVLDKYFQGNDCGNLECEKQCVQFCKIAERTGIQETAVKDFVLRMLKSHPICILSENDEKRRICRFYPLNHISCLALEDNGRKIIGKRYISDADASKSGACKACLEYAGHVFKWPEEKDKMPVLPRHPNCKCHYEDVYEENTKEDQEKFLRIKAEELNQQFTVSKQKIASLAKGKSTLLAQKKNNKPANSRQYVQTILETANIYLALTHSIKDEIQTLSKGLGRFSQWVKENITYENLKTSAENLVVNRLVEIANCRSLSKEEHYARIKLYCQKLKYLPKSPADAIKQGYTKAKDRENRYHGLHLGNEKYYNQKTGQEVVFDKNGNVVLDDKYLGTYNYGTYPVSIDHAINDIWPYWKWGNTPNDTTPLDKRIWGTGKEEK